MPIQLNAAPIYKECTYCNITKHVECFSPFASGKCGRASRCKPCRSKIQVIWNREKKAMLKKNSHSD